MSPDLEPSATPLDSRADDELTDRIAERARERFATLLPRLGDEDAAELADDAAEGRASDREHR